MQRSYKFPLPSHERETHTADELKGPCHGFARADQAHFKYPFLSRVHSFSTVDANLQLTVELEKSRLNLHMYPHDSVRLRVGSREIERGIVCYI